MTKSEQKSAKPAKRPTPEQLAKITTGGSYVFNQDTSKTAITRKPTAPKKPAEAK